MLANAHQTPMLSATISTQGAEVSDRPRLDLSSAAVRAHWSHSNVGRLIAAMERCEVWAVDRQPENVKEVERIIEMVAAAFNSASSQAIANAVEGDGAYTLALMGYLRSGRALALFAWLTELDGALASRLVAAARSGVDDFGRLLIERISTLEKQHLLSRVFSPERISLVLELLSESGLTQD